MALRHARHPSDPLRLFPAMKRRGIQIDQYLCTSRFSCLSWRLMPNVLADRQTKLHAAKRHHARLRTGVEVAFFIEDLIVRQTLFVVLCGDLLIGDHARRIEQCIPPRFGIADDHQQVGR